jgi:acyl-[acyl carrier protein]--UDP-N-acetylglucosamine O-acyltransferase
LSNLSVSNNTNLLGNLYVSGFSLINSNASINSNLYVSGLAKFNNGIITPIINASGNTLNINGSIINIGNSNSIINIIGTTNYIASNNLVLVDKIISLNLNTSTGTGFDIGGLSGIEILGTSGTGFIKTTSDATQFQICPPTGGPTMYIATVDLNNNLFISGVTTLNNNTTLYSQLFVSGTTNINGNITINSNLNISGDTILNGSTTISSSLYVSGNAIFNANTTILGILTVSGNTIINGNTTIMGSLTVSGMSILNGSTTIMTNLFVSGNTTLQGNTTFGSSLNISGYTNINGTASFNSNLLINSNAIFNGDSTILSSMTVSNNTVLNLATTVSSNLYVSGQSIITGNITLGTNLATFSILGNITSQLNEYPDNKTASAAGVPIWGWYRTGGIIKIRLDDIPPVIYLSGPSTVTCASGLNYTELGVYAIDNIDGNVIPYLSSIANTTTSNIISSPIVINGSKLITAPSILSSGSYIITYNATDNAGNIGYNYRNLNII